VSTCFYPIKRGCFIFRMAAFCHKPVRGRLPKSAQAHVEADCSQHAAVNDGKICFEDK
jgi:hypothetical protein